MCKLKIFVLLSMLVATSGCAVVSLHPLATPSDKDAVFDPALLGTWQGDSTDVRYTVTRTGSGYSVTTDDLQLMMQLLKIDGRYLLDVYCPSDGAALPVHLFFKLRLSGDQIWLAGMDSDWLKEQIAANAQLRHEVLSGDGEDRTVLTGSSAELRRTLLPYIADDRSFDDEEELKRVK